VTVRRRGVVGVVVVAVVGVVGGGDGDFALLGCRKRGLG
jgi:hypothetical protein